MNNVHNLSVQESQKKRGREMFYRIKPILSALEKIYSFFPLGYRNWIWDRKARKKGLLQIGLRWALLKSIALDAGNNIHINESCYIRHPSQLKIGSNVSIWPMTYI